MVWLLKLHCFGGRIVNLWVPDKYNQFRDVVTGFNSISEYQQSGEVYFQTLIGHYGTIVSIGVSLRMIKNISWQPTMVLITCMEDQKVFTT